MNRIMNFFFAAAGLVLLVLPLSAQEKTLDELLALDLSELLDLKVVSALKSPETISRTPATVRVITSEQIRDGGCLTLEDALSDLPGFQFRNILGFNSYSFIRGIPGQNNKILLLMDGLQINELNSGGFYGGGQFNLAEVERIEVIYGPASALYGTNALSGIINIVTRDPRAGSSGRVSAGWGTFGARLAEARYGSYDTKADFGFTAAAMLKRNEKADLAGAAGDFNWTEDIENFENDAAVQARVHFKDFEAGFLLQDENASRATVERTAGEDLSIPWSDHGVNWHIRFINVWARYSYEKKKNWSFRNTAYYRNSTVLDDTISEIEQATSDSPGRQFRYYRPNSLIGNEAQIQWTPDPRWRFSAGLVLERERLAEGFSVTVSSSADAVPAAPLSPAMMTNRLFSAYAQVQGTAAEGLDLFLGLRHDDSSYYGAVNTPRLGVVYNRGRLTAKALYMRAFRAPKPWDYTAGAGNSGLRPEKIDSFEIAGGWSFSSCLRLDLSVYRNRLTNLLRREDGTTNSRWINAGTLTTDGGEAGLIFRRGSWRAWASYTYTASMDEAGVQAPEIAPHGAAFGAAYAFTPRLTLSLRGCYFGERKNPKIIPSTGSDRIEGAIVARAALSWRLSAGFDVQLAVDNLFDAVYYHPSNLPPSRYRQPPRSFRFAVGYSFR